MWYVAVLRYWQWSKYQLAVISHFNNYVLHLHHITLGKTESYARSKPDTVERPVRTVHTFVRHYNSTQYCNMETV